MQSGYRHSEYGFEKNVAKSFQDGTISTIIQIHRFPLAPATEFCNGGVESGQFWYVLHFLELEPNTHPTLTINGSIGFGECSASSKTRATDFRSVADAMR